MTNGFQRFQAAFGPQRSLLDEQLEAQGMAPQGGLLGRMDPTLLGLASGLLEAGQPTVGAPAPGIGVGLSRGLQLGNQFAQQRDAQMMQGLNMLQRQQAAERQQQLDVRRRQAFETLSGGDPRMMAALELAPGQVVGSMMPQQADLTARMQNVMATLPPEHQRLDSPVFQEAMRADMAQDPGTTVNVDVPVSIPPEETEQRKQNAKFLSQTRQTTEEAATAAQRAQLNVNRAKQLIRTADPNALAPLRLQVQRFLRPLGVDVDTSQMGAAEALQSVGTGFVLDQIQNTKGAVSDAEMRIFAQAAPGLSRSREGNLLMLELLEAKNKRDIELAKRQREYARDRGGQLDFGWFDERDRYIAQNPLFTEDVRDRIDQIQGGDAFAPAAPVEQTNLQPAPPQFQDGSVIRNKRTGEEFLVRDGMRIPLER